MTPNDPQDHVLPSAASANRPDRHRETFGLIVRVAGLFVTLYGLYCLTFSFIADATSATTRNPGEVYTVFGLVFTFAGGILVHGRWIVWFAYGSLRD